MPMAGSVSLCLDFSGENRWHHPNVSAKGKSCETTHTGCGERCQTPALGTLDDPPHAGPSKRVGEAERERG